MLKPYYETENGKLYHGACEDVLTEIEDKVDLCLTDPPYGIGSKWVGGFGKNHGWSKSHIEKETRNEWDAKPPSKECFDIIMAMSEKQIIWGGNYFDLPPSRCWLVWNKPERNFTLAEAELAWTNADNVVRVYDRRRHENNRVHPTQKPVELFIWCLGLSWSKAAQIICDPFAGSGTTGIACERLNRKYILIEKELEYVEIAAQRISREIQQLKLF